MDKMISLAFKNFLQQERRQCNQLYATLRHQHPQIDAENFQQFLIHQLDPVIALLDQAGQSIANFAMAGYQHGLDLAAKRWLGKGEFYIHVGELWRDVIPHCLPWIATNPHYWLSILANILCRLSTHSPASATHWLTLMNQSANKCQSADELKKLGLILAWMSGLACYRQSALIALTEISDALFISISKADIKDRATIQQALAHNRWLDFSITQPTSFSLQKRFGNSQLFDGEFPEPPKVLAHNNQLYLTSANQIWVLFFDAFGEMLVNVQDANLSSIFYSQDPNELSIQMQTYLKMDVKSKIMDLSSVASCAQLDDSLALTSKDSFAVILLNR